MLEEIIPNLYRTEIPLPNNPLKWLNAYIVKSGDRFLIIDTGFNRPECLDAMNASLKKLDVELAKTDFFITHLHVDHIGLVGRLASDRSKIYFNALEAKRIDSLLANRQRHWEQMLSVYIANGFDDSAARSSMASLPAHKLGLHRAMEFTMVNDGDRFDFGDFHFRCLATPGHSPGHTCLYESEKKILVAGDHILSDITPSITYWPETEDSLGNYLASLEKVGRLDAAFVLPGHRRLVQDLRGRVEELQEHHRARLNEVLAALEGGEKDIFQTAHHISWDIARKWDAFPPAQKWFAFGETFAHVNYLVARGKVRRKNKNGKMTYALV